MENVNAFPLSFGDSGGVKRCGHRVCGRATLLNYCPEFVLI